jgi:hypothetical protein
MGIHIVDKELVDKIERIAQQERRQQVEVIAQAMHLYEQQTLGGEVTSFLLAIADLGNSGQGDVSARDEEILEKEIDPLRGWDLKQDAP